MSSPVLGSEFKMHGPKIIVSKSHGNQMYSMISYTCRGTPYARFLYTFGQFRMRNSIFQILKIEDYFKTMTVKIACWVSN